MHRITRIFMLVIEQIQSLNKLVSCLSRCKAILEK